MIRKMQAVILTFFLSLFCIDSRADIADVNCVTVRSGMEGMTCFVSPFLGITSDGLYVMTIQKLLLTASDVVFDVHEMRSDDHGQTWTEPAVLSESLKCIRRDNSTRTSYAVGPSLHAQSGKLLCIGTTVDYKSNRILPGSRDIIYSVFDDDQKVWGPCKKLVLPERDDFYAVSWSSNQRYDLPDGKILLPVSHRPKADSWSAQASTTVLLCDFDGQNLKYLKCGNTLSLNVKRGFCEPSVTSYGGKYYLTLRNDLKGYVTVSDDGLHYQDPIVWKFDDGQELGNYNTQQHWITHEDGLYLVYTRKTPNNNNVFRNRAPLFCGQVDPEKMCIIRRTEKAIVPNRGARLGNFGITPVGPNESWVTVAEWMQHDKVGFGQPGIDYCRKYGSDNAIFIAKIKTE